MNYTWEIKNIGDSVDVLYSSAVSDVLVSIPKCEAGTDLDTHISRFVPTYQWEKITTIYTNEEVVGLTGSGIIGIDLIDTDNMTLDDVKTNRKLYLAAERYQAEKSGVSFMGSPISSDREGQTILTSKYLALKDGLISLTRWKAKDGAFLSLDLDNTKQLLVLIINHIEACFDKEQTLVAQINAATSKEEVESITW